MKPLDDVVPVGVCDHHHHKDRLVPDHSTEKLPKIGRLTPSNVEEANYAAHEDQDIAGTEVGATAAHPLHQDDTGQGDHYHQERIGHHYAEEEHQRRQSQSDLAVGHGDVPHNPGGHHRGHPAGRPTDPLPPPGPESLTGYAVRVPGAEPAHGTGAPLLIGPRSLH